MDQSSVIVGVVTIALAVGCASSSGGPSTAPAPSVGVADAAPTSDASTPTGQEDGGGGLNAEHDSGDGAATGTFTGKCLSAANHVCYSGSVYSDECRLNQFPGVAACPTTDLLGCCDQATNNEVCFYRGYDNASVPGAPEKAACPNFWTTTP